MTSQKPRRSVRISLRTLLVIVAVVSVATWWWQKPYKVESIIALTKLPVTVVNDQIARVEGKRIETMRRLGWRDVVKDGPVREYDERGALIFEENWLHGVRHGLYRRWDRESRDLVTELEFRRGNLARVGDTAVDDFLQNISEETAAGKNMRSQLTNDTIFYYTDLQLCEVLQDIAVRHDTSVFADARALESAGIGIGTPVSAKLGPMPLFAALSATLAPLELTCIYKYESLWITTTTSGLRKYSLQLEAAGPRLLAKLDEPVTLHYLDKKVGEILTDISIRRQIAIIHTTEEYDGDNVTLFFVKKSLHSVLGSLCYLHGMTVEADGESLIVRRSREGNGN